MKHSTIARILLVGALAVALAALAGCNVKGGTNSPAPAESAGSNQPEGNAAPQNETVSTAMVAYANGDDVLLVDQETQTPYFPLNIDNVAITSNGQPIDEDDLAVGNIVKVTGDGIMLESYPGQYPGITSIEVTSVGSPADAEKYADIVSEVFPGINPAEVPAGNLEYKTAEAQVSTFLNPYEYEWQWTDEAGKTARDEQEGSETTADGTLADSVIDVRISSPVDTVAIFSAVPTAVEIERTPLAQSNPAKVDPRAEDVGVPFTMGADGTVAFTIEPNNLYVMNLEFPQGEASYAFYTMK